MGTRLISAIPIILAVAVGSQTSTSVPPRPDFSGQWVFEAAVGPPPPPGVFGSARRNEWGDEVSIQQTATELIIAYERSGLRTSVTFKLDGSPSRNALNTPTGSLEQVGTAKWERDKLVIVLTTGESVQTRTIAFDGPKLKVTTSGGRRPDSVVLYRKR
jgi:hypothetical protein